MSRIVNLKTIRFQIFNILDSWHANWADDIHYGNLLYEDLSIRSYFIGIFYRLRMPTNYLYIHRMSGNTLMLNTDVYFYKPFKHTKLRRYFVEQKLYINYLLKLYLYFLPSFFSLFSTTSVRSCNLRKRISFFHFRKLRQFGSMGYVELKNDRYNSVLVSPSIFYYQFSNLYSSIFLFLSKRFSLCRFYSKFRSKSINRSKSKFRISSLLSSISNVLSRFYYISLLNGSTSFSFLKCIKYFQFGLPSRHFLFSFLCRQSSFLQNVTLSSYFSFSKNRFRGKRDKMYTLHRTYLKFKHNIFMSIDKTYIGILDFICRNKPMIVVHRKLHAFRKHFCINSKHKDYYNMYSLARKKIVFLLTYWLSHLIKNSLLYLLFKLLIGLSFVFKHSHFVYCYLFRCFHLLTIQRFVISYSLRSRTASIFNANHNRVNFLSFFSRLKNIHSYYSQGRRATVNRLATPKRLQYGYINTHFLKIFFSYFFNHIETVISSYTKQQVYCLYNLFYLGIQYYPPILNAKVLCDYFIYMIHGKRSIRGAFYKVRQWQLANIQRRLAMESMYFKTQIKRQHSSYLNHLSYKKYPVLGVRMECSGNKKKGTMARKFFYGDVIKKESILQKYPNNTFNADLDYYQSFALTKSCSIGVKVWVFFKTHLYNKYGSIKSLIVY